MKTHCIETTQEFSHIGFNTTGYIPDGAVFLGEVIVDAPTITITYETVGRFIPRLMGRRVVETTRVEVHVQGHKPLVLENRPSTVERNSNSLLHDPLCQPMQVYIYGVPRAGLETNKKVRVYMAKLPFDTNMFNKGQKVWMVRLTGQLAAQVRGKFRGSGRYVTSWVKWGSPSKDLEWKQIDVDAEFAERLGLRTCDRIGEVEVDPQG